MREGAGGVLATTQRLVVELGTARLNVVTASKMGALIIAVVTKPFVFTKAPLQPVERNW